MRTLIFILLASTSLFAQEGFKVTRHKGSVTYHQAYLNCTSTELRLLIEDNAMGLPSIRAKEFLAKYPVLNDINKFKKRKKYSLISSTLLSKEPELTDQNFLVFTFKNGKTYKIHLTKRVKNVYL